MRKITIICILMLLISFAGAIDLSNADVYEKAGSVVLPNKLPTIAYTIEWTLNLNHTSCLGCTPVGDTLLWVSSAGRTGTADPNWILIYNLRTIPPTLIDSFLQTPTDAWGYRDMCFNNGYVYAGSGADSTLHKIDPATHTVVGTYPVTGISGEAIIRALTDNDVEDSLWTANWNSPIYKFGNQGGAVRTVANNTFYIYGLAYDPHGFVWGSSQYNANLVKFSYPAFTILDYCNIPELAGLAGGCEMWKDTFLLYLTQGTANKIYCFRLYTSSFTNDVGVEAIIAPGDLHIPNTPMAPIALVKNYGTAAASSFPVTCSIFGTGDTLRYANAQTVSSLGAGDTTRINFASWTPSIQENLAVKMRTGMTGDQDSSNDQKTTTTAVASYLLFEKFNLMAFPPIGWQANIISGTYNWQRFSAGTFPTCTPYEGSAMTGYNSYSASGGSEARLISPAIVLGSAPRLCTLKFWMVHDPGYGSAPDSVKIQISPDGTSFTQVASIARYGVTLQWTEHTIVLGNLSGTLYIGFLAHSGYGNNMYIDYVSLSAGGVPTPQRDVGVNAIRYPMATHSKDVPMIPIGKVKNFGSAAQTFPAVCSILGAGSAVRYINTQTVPTLAPNDTALVNFGSWTPTIAENITVIMRTLLTNDSNPDNDRMTQSSTIIAGFLYESFESTTFPPAGWQTVIGNGTYNWTRTTAGTNPTCSPYHGTAMATYSCFDAAAGSYARLITPQIPVGNNNPCTLKFYMYHNDEYSGSGGYGPDSVKVETSTNGTTFTQVAAIARYGTVNQWQEHTVYLGTFSGNLWVSLLGWSDYGGNIFVDLVRINGRTGIEEIKPNIITMTTLHAPKPNPATNGLVKISFTIAAPTKASLKIYDVSGKLVKTLVDNNLNTGIYNNTWNGTDDNNYEIADGIYFCTLKTDNNNYTKKLVFTR